MLNRFLSVHVFVLIALFILGVPLTSDAQNQVITPDTTRIEQPLAGDTLAIVIPLQDTTQNAQDTVAKKKNGLEDLVHATAKDSIIYAVESKKVYLHKTAKVVYQDLQIEAGYIVIDYVTQDLFACGIPDSTGTKIVETPKFKEGEQEYEMETITYNFKTKKAKISTVITHQGEGFLHSAETKLMPDKSVNVGGGKYTTCDHPHPHFYLSMTKAKMIPDPNSKVVFGPSYLVIEDVPLYIIGLPFGFFPKMSDRSSGLLFPTFGEEASRGFYLQGLGYYFVLGEYADFATTIDYYTLGSWASHNIVRYKKRYRFDGSLNFDITNTVMGDKGSTDYFKSGNFSFKWSHAQAQQANPTTRFSASVNVSSPTYSSLNGMTLNDRYSPSTNSSVSFAKNWEDKPISMSINLTHSQHMINSGSTLKREGTYTLGLPSLTFDVGKFAPFKRKNAVGKEKFYEGFKLSYKMRFENSITFSDKEWGEPDFFDKLDNGMSHSFGIDLPSFSLLKYINVSPSVSYGQNWHFKSTQYEWNNTTNALDTITSGAFSEFGVTQNYGFGLSMNTTLYGIHNFKGTDPLVKAVRHIIKPSIGFSYNPNLQNHANGLRSVQYNENGDIREYNIYNYSGAKFQALGGGKSASMNISIGNSLEFKLRNRKDTTGTNSLKLKLLESFNISTSYNFMADSLNLANIGFSGRTNILDKFGMNFTFTVDPYEIAYVDGSAQKINKLYWAKHKGLNFGRMTNFSTSFDYTISGGKGKGVETTQNPNPEEGVDYFSPHNTLYYINYSVPWSLSFSVIYTMSKTYSPSIATQALTTITNNLITLNFRGSVSPTKNWMVSFSSGFDFDAGKLANTQMSIHRDLHCFEFNFSWTPIGVYKSWNFGINVKGSTLRDLLKYDKRSSMYDNYFNAL